MKMELRNSKIEFRVDNQTDSQTMHVSGYVNRTGEWSEVLGNTTKFVERIAPGAFARALQNATNDIDFLAEHNDQLILASTRNNSLQLKEDDTGLYMEATIAPTSWGKDYYQLISDGILRNMSFGFVALKDSWDVREDGVYERTIEDLELVEVSVVKNPAYSQSTIAARGIDVVEDVKIPSEFLENKEKEERMTNSMIKINENADAKEFEKILRGESRSLNTTADGGALIPENVANEIVLKMENISPVFAQARKFTSITGNLKVARENDSIVAGFVGEGNDVIEGQLGLEFVELQQKRVGAAITITNQLINDSAVSITDYVQNLLARRVAKAVEKAILTGNGNEEFKGIINDAEVATVNVSGAVTLDDLQSLYLGIHPDFLDQASFIMEREFFNQIAKMKDNMGHYYLQNGVVNGVVTHTLFGLPVYTTDALPETTPVVFGNITEAYAVLIKQDMGLQEIQDSGLALKGSKMFLLDAYMDGAVVNPQAIVKLTVNAG
ncbi:phage major capsid protein [Bacillus smithii]|uniref:phage major capsid protein n=1 Tax=Bacillus smithii TaxID=1479 RepID=UPI003D26177D